MPQALDDESLPTTIPELEQQIEQLRQQHALCAQQVLDLKEAEDFTQRIFYAAEIFSAQRMKLQLAVSIQLREVRVRRLLLEDAATK